MSSMSTIRGRPQRRGEPAWEVASLFPAQGDWTEQEYLNLEENSGNRLIELVDGFHPQEQTITVLYLSGRSYKVHGVFGAGETAVSRMFPGLVVDVAETFAAGRGGR